MRFILPHTLKTGNIICEDKETTAMGILDDLFQKDKKSKFEETMDSLMDSEILNGKTMKKAVGTLNDAADGITAGLSELLGEDAPEPSADRTSVPDFDTKSKEWDRMITALQKKELRKFKICPKCGQAANANNNYCPECGSKLPDHTAAVRICPKCGAENDPFAETCVKCGEHMPFIDIENFKE